MASHRSFNVEAQIRSQDNAYGIYSLQNFTDFLLVLWFSLASVIPAMVHAYTPFIYNQRYIISTTDNALQPKLLFLFENPPRSRQQSPTKVRSYLPMEKASYIERCEFSLTQLCQSNPHNIHNAYMSYLLSQGNLF